MSEIGVGLIGCGSMGKSLGTALRQVEGARLVGAADVDAAAAERLGGELRAPGYGSAEALLEQPGVDAVIVASPGFQHRPLAELAAARGKHLFVEKPLAANRADCDAILAAAGRAGVLLMVGQVLRYYPCWWKCLQLVRAGEIGAPIGITVTRIGGRLAGMWERSWRNSLEKSGGLLMEVNAHEIDFMCQVAGDVERVYAEADRYLDEPCDFPNLNFVSLRFKSGAVGMLHSGTTSAMSELSGKILGTEGTIFYTNGMGGAGEIRLAKFGGEPQTIRIAEIEKEPPVREELRRFVEAIRAGGPSPIPGEEGRRNVIIAEAAYESARTGRPVQLG